MDSEAKASYIRSATGKLMVVFGRKENPNLIDVFERVLSRFSVEAIKKAFLKAEESLDRFPTPKLMAELCAEFSPSESWRYNFRPGEAPDPETGMFVPVLIDPDPNCSVCRDPKSWHPTKKCKTYTPSGLGDDTVMFRPQDCPEGREFLRLFAKIAGRTPSV